MSLLGLNHLVAQTLRRRGLEPMSKIDETFVRLRKERQTGLVTFVTAGDPNLERTESILMALDEAGSDVLEVGAPFSDPLADGPVIQRASERALASNTTLATTLGMVARVRSRLKAPIVIFSYFNLILALGIEEFATQASSAGVDGVLVLDLPIEEAGEFRAIMMGAGIDTIFLLSPTTTEKRISKAAELGQGFLYGISRLGVTGVRNQIDDGAERMTKRIRALTDMPLALGFGVSTPEQVATVGRIADAAVVGSGLVSVIEEASEEVLIETKVREYIRWLKSGQTAD